LKTVTSGNINNFVPQVNAYLSNDGILSLSTKGEISFTVDTGFSGGIAIPISIIEKMKTEIVTYDTFSLATGEIIELPVFIGDIRAGRKRIETWFIPGDFLLGMEFLYSVCKYISLDLIQDKIVLST